VTAGLARALPGVALCAALAACAPLPTSPEPGAEPGARGSPPGLYQAPSNTARGAAVSRHAELAKAATDAGDHAAALSHHEVLALLEPASASHRQAIESSQLAIERGVREALAAGAAARRSGDAVRARDAYLRAIALDPRHAEAAAALREIEQQQMARLQSERAARARSLDAIVAGAKSRAQAPSQADGYDVEQRIELLSAGDVTAGLREARAWVDANPGDRDGRLRLATAVAERARDAERRGQRESALMLYDAANVLAPAPSADWTARTRELRRALGEARYTEGVKAMRIDLAAAIGHFEASLRFNPDHAKAAQRLREARAAQEKLRKFAR
jgi:tetratricopeptide (TPR) repeat protein